MRACLSLEGLQHFLQTDSSHLRQWQDFASPYICVKDDMVRRGYVCTVPCPVLGEVSWQRDTQISHLIVADEGQEHFVGRQQQAGVLRSSRKFSQVRSMDHTLCALKCCALKA